MKKFILIALMFSIPILAESQCDKVIYKKLRLGDSFKFTNTYNNNSKYIVGISNKTTYKFTEKRNEDINDGLNPKIIFSNNLKNRKYFIAPHSKLLHMISSDYYKIRKHPSKREKDNISIQYKTVYGEKRLNGEVKGPFTYTACANYEVTWCGDGIRDNYKVDSSVKFNKITSVFEECDPMDKTEDGWGTGGCSTACKRVEKPKSNICNQISYRKVRHGRNYSFGNIFKNDTNKIVEINKCMVSFSDVDDDLNDGENPDFKFTSWIKNKKFKINDGEKGKIYEAKVDYPIKYLPKKRSKNNIFIKYTTKYYTVDNGKREGPFFDVYCDHNEVTWCGDNILDKDYETCDDGNFKSGDGCSSTCQLEKK